MALSVPTLLLPFPFFLLLLLLLLPLLFRLLLRQTKQNIKTKLPPGPPPLPIIGNLHQLGHIPHRSLRLLSKLHGPLLHLRLGRIPTLVISSPSLAQQILKTHDLSFCSRPPLLSFQTYSFRGSDVAAASYGDHWRNLRKVFILELLSSKKLPAFRSVREEETDRMIRSIITRPDQNSAVNISELMIRLTNNIICQVAFGYKSEGEYGERSRFHGILEETHGLMASFFVADYFPGFGWVDVVTGKRRRLERNAKELDDFYQEVIDEHLDVGRRRRRRKEGGEEEDIVDVLIRLWREGEAQLTMDHIKGALMNIFIAGTDTSAATVIWTMAELARHPSVMKKAQDEVRRLIGKKGKVEESDLPQLQYLKLVVNESLRLHPPLPLLIPRETTQHCKINGYDVCPKTRVLVNAWAIGRDEDYWKNPEEFIPERFVGSSIDYKGHDFQFIPFGAGRRICPGIYFGIASVELALANFLYAFDWELPSGMKNEDIDMNEAPGVVTHKKSAMLLVARNI